MKQKKPLLDAIPSAEHIWRQNDYANTREEKHINTQDKSLQIKINHPQVRHSEVVAQTVTHVKSDIEDTKTIVAAQQKIDYI